MTLEEYIQKLLVQVRRFELLSLRRQNMKLLDTHLPLKQWEEEYGSFLAVEDAN